MKNEMQMVREWRKAFALPVSEVLKLPTPDQLELHREMIVDEADGEIGCAATTDDVRDVCVDLIYFILGLAAESGITGEQLGEDFKAVHEANMRKLWTIDQVNELCTKQIGVSYWELNAENPDGWSIVQCRDHDMFTVRYKGKIQKPPGWKAAELRKIGGGE